MPYYDDKDKRLRKLGWTLEAYTAAYAKQEAKCAICKEYEVKRDPAGRIQTLCADHSHITGKARELLCNNCNRCLGILENGHTILEAMAILKRMMLYLIKHEK